MTETTLEDQGNCGQAGTIRRFPRSAVIARVLVIEDESYQRHLMCSFLAQGGHKGVEAANGMDGMVALTRTSIDLVICDMQMPIQDGIETIRRIRGLDPRVPIVAISGSFRAANSPLLEAALAVGADATLEKPFGMEQLLALVDGLLEFGAEG